MILCRINKKVYLYLFEHANTRKHVYEHSCSSVKVFFCILAHLAHLAHLAFKSINKEMILIISGHANTRKHVLKHSLSSV